MAAVLIAGSEPEARAWQRRYPDRWTDIIPANRVGDGALLGMRVDSVHITPGAVDLDHATVVHEALYTMALSNTGHAEPVYLDPL